MKQAKIKIFQTISDSLINKTSFVRQDGLLDDCKTLLLWNSEMIPLFRLKKVWRIKRSPAAINTFRGGNAENHQSQGSCVKLSLANNSVESAKQDSLVVSIEGISLTLLAKRGVYWPAHNTLFVADTHFGKEATFRTHGIAAPRGSTQGTLTSISEMISECGASRLVLLGDMFHARSSISQDIRLSLDEFFQSHNDVQTSLVLGNHDRGIHAKIRSWPIEILAPGFAMDSISVSHYPQPHNPLTKVLLCGHIHPAIRLATRTDSIGKAPCFWLSNRQLVLPAVGEFTGTKLVHPSKADKTWIIVDNQIFPL